MTNDPVEVTRSVDLEASAEQVWEAVADPERRRAWLDDDDAAERVTRLDEIEPGRSLTWTWWHPDEPAQASRVEVLVTELAEGGTRVVVTERILSRGLWTSLQAKASARALTATWDSRLVGLELVLMTAGICVG